LLAPGGVDQAGAQALVDLGPGVAQRGGLQPVAAHPQQPDALADGPQQLDGVALDRRAPLGAAGEPGGARGDAGLGGGQPAVGQQGEPVTVGGNGDQGVEAGEQPAIGGWHGGSLPKFRL
jgi:hypothetical protein